MCNQYVAIVTALGFKAQGCDALGSDQGIINEETMRLVLSITI